MKTVEIPSETKFKGGCSTGRFATPDSPDKNTKQDELCPPHDPAGGEMHRRIREFNWSQHPLGVPPNWPQNLSTALNICLSSKFPIILYWGRDLHVFYNDAYIPIFGAKHPHVLGLTCREVWAEIWDVIGPMFQQVLENGEATWSADQLLLVRRFGYLEEAYFTWSFSPIHGERGHVDGVFTAVFETTARVLVERRLQILRELGSNATLARTVDEACTRFIRTLDQNRPDIPFALVYLLDERERKLLLRGDVRVPSNHPARIDWIRLDSAFDEGWPLAEALSNRKPVVVPDLQKRFPDLPGGPWPESPQSAVVLPIPGADAGHSLGVLVVGVNPLRALDDDYEGFFQLVAGQFAAALSNAQTYEKQRERAEALTELDRAKTAFFSNVSHEFRTPLTLILGPLEQILSEGAVFPEEIRKELEVVHRNSLRLLKLVNTLLEFSRLEVGRIHAHFEPVNLASLTTDLASAFRSIMDKAGLRFDVECAPLSEQVFVDRDMWEKIVFNLLSNAFKFTFHGGVSVTLSSELGHAVLRISDSGSGIPSRELPHVFKRFHRVQNARSRTHEGTGIGLALVQELVKLHGGSISVDSKVAEGTVFTVRIPFGTNHLPAERIGKPRLHSSSTIQNPAFVEEAIHWLPDTLADGPEPAVARQITEQRPRILIVDDNLDMRNYVSRLLRERYDSMTAADGMQALQAARESKPDLILSDIMMPQLDGFALLRAIREDSRLKTVPIILLSARAGDEARVEGLQLAADDYLVKPFSGRELLARVETHLRLARIRAGAAEREKQLRDEAQSTKQRLDAVLSSIEEQFFILDSDFRYVYVNDRVLEATNKRRGDLLHKCIWDLFPDTRLGIFHDHVTRASSEKQAVRFEYFYPGWQRWFDIRVYPISEGIALLAADITKRKQMEDALRKTRQELIEVDCTPKEYRF